MSALLVLALLLLLPEVEGAVSAASPPGATDEAAAAGLRAPMVQAVCTVVWNFARMLKAAYGFCEEGLKSSKGAVFGLGAGCSW